MLSITARVCARMSSVAVPSASTSRAGDRVVRAARARAGDEDESCRQARTCGNGPRGVALSGNVRALRHSCTQTLVGSV